MLISNRTIIKSRILNASKKKLWWKWTTHEGLKTFFSDHNKIELHIGGAFEIYFLMDSPYGSRGSEGCKVLSFLPEKMFSFSWNAPPQFQDIRNSNYHTWIVRELNELEENKVEVTLTHTGWPEDETWHPVFDYFNQAWEMVMDNLQHSIK